MRPISTLALALVLGTLSATAHPQENNGTPDDADPELWLSTLITDTPQEGFDLAITLARKGVGTTQPDTEVLQNLRPAYAHDPDSLIAASQVVAIHFQTVAAANNYWRSE